LPFRPIVSFPNFAALGVGVLSYFALAIIVGWLLPHLSPGMGAVIGALLFISPGVLLGFIAKRSPLMHGLLLGVLTVAFMAILVAVTDALGVKGTPSALHELGSMAMVSTLVLMIASSLGAVLGDFVGDKLRGL
jgi:hypothetical protein